MDIRATRPLALQGLTVLELGQFLAAPFCGYMLAGFGAEVIKVEPPDGGDPLRRWRKLVDGTSLWWRSLSRDKRCITCDLRQPEGQALIKRLVASGIDVVVENFRPGRLESWGLDYATLRELNPRVIMVRISGYGQDGPLSSRPGFANIAEAFGGLRYVTGTPGGPPMRCGVSLADSLAGLHAAYGALAAVYERDHVRASISAPGKAALEAAARPADGDWMYFVTVNLETGETKFAKTQAEHDKYVKEFQQWCQAKKGRCDS